MVWGGDEKLQGSSATYAKVWSICLIPAESLAAVATLFRLRLRHKRGLLWWDDFFALAALLMALPVFASTYILLLQPSLRPLTNVRITWVVLATFHTSAWLARVSWLLSIARTTSHRRSVYRALIMVAYLLIPIWLGCVVPIIISCSRNKTWQLRSPYLCLPSISASAFAFLSSVLVDVSLALAALKMYWRVNLAPAVRRLVLIGFTAGSTMSPAIVAVAFSCLLLPPPSASNLEDITQYLVLHVGLLSIVFGCNAVVIFTFVYQLWRRPDAETSSQISSLSRIPLSNSTSVGPIVSGSYTGTGGSTRFRPPLGGLTEISMGISHLSTTSGQSETTSHLDSSLIANKRNR
ncbi:hypothetical protein CPB83DRAFT_843547 [Crepidotus variabilis]|uniref:Rhodopsin domain-containing protein n=1 Tax=Crepidotus variabilis TaxID=179855 RepID=A0A9P6ES68_9AGAR|nr:hypothetical protein CPB83DRAFT_843547 [Crepidotus variabilis]